MRCRARLLTYLVPVLHLAESLSLKIKWPAGGRRWLLSQLKPTSCKINTRRVSPPPLKHSNILLFSSSLVLFFLFVSTYSLYVCITRRLKIDYKRLGLKLWNFESQYYTRFSEASKKRKESLVLLALQSQHTFQPFHKKVATCDVSVVCPAANNSSPSHLQWPIQPWCVISFWVATVNVGEITCLFMYWRHLFSFNSTILRQGDIKPNKRIEGKVSPTMSAVNWPTMRKKSLYVGEWEGQVCVSLPYPKLKGVCCCCRST